MEKIATCPVCGQGDLIEGTNGYLCNHFKSTSDKCCFVIYSSYFGKKITPEIAFQLATTQETEVFFDLVTKDNNQFSAKLVVSKGVVAPLFDKRILSSSCPKCGGVVHITSKGFICERYFQDKSCDFYINRSVAGVSLSENDAEILLNGSSTDYRTDFLSANQREFGAKLFLDDDFQIKFDFEIVKCPKCQSGSISSNHWAYGCSNYKNPEIKCEFTIWREISGKKITIQDLLDLCQSGISGKTKFKPKIGEEYTGYYKLDKDFKLEIVKNS